MNTPSLTTSLMPSAIATPIPVAAVEAVVTVTTVLTQTLTATLSETITVAPTWVSQPALTMPTPTVSRSTITLFEIAIILEDQLHRPYSTWTIPVTAVNSSSWSGDQPTTFVLVVDPQSASYSGWDSWSPAQKGGLIAGVVIAFILLLGILMVMAQRQRSGFWIANDWSVRSDSNWFNQPTGQLLFLRNSGPAYRA